MFHATDPSLAAKSARDIGVLHTLGPEGTNCEAAAKLWLERKGARGEVRLFPTLEEALEALPPRPDAALLGCAVYPDLHRLVFENLHRIEIFDTFVMPTYEMVLASRDGAMPADVVSHPAPSSLVPEGLRVSFADSNSRAAALCAEGAFEGCITTSRSAGDFDLSIVRNFGAVPMIFTLHRPHAVERAKAA